MTDHGKSDVSRLVRVKCVNAHDRCDGGPCPYCEPVFPLRDDKTGKFVSSRRILACITTRMENE